MPAYSVPRKSVECEYEIKKSRFIARAAFAANRNQAMDLLKQAKHDYPDARHHCWAYLLGNPLNASSAAMSDDGEPGGTAGKPILNVLQHKGVGDIMLIIIRYFGGIKLGAGGLVRAYSASAQQVMENLPLIQQQVLCSVTLGCEFSLEQKVRHWLSLHSAEIIEVLYTQNVTLKIQLPESELLDIQAFAAALGIIFDHEIT